MIARTIHEYARGNMIKELQAALEGGTDPNEKDCFGSTALQNAITEKKEEAAVMIIKYGADITMRDVQGRTALHYAIEHRMPSVAALLLNTEPGILAIDDKHGNGPLWVATFNARGDYHMVSLLLAYGADPSHRNRAGLSPVDFAERIGDETLKGKLKFSEEHVKDNVADPEIGK